MKRPSLMLKLSAGLAFLTCVSAFCIASVEPASVDFFAQQEPARPCAKTSAPKLEMLEALGPMTEVIEPNILEAFKSRMSAMKQSGEYDRRFKANKDRIAQELQNPTAVPGLTKAQKLRVWELTPSVPETLPESLLRQAQNVEIPKLSRALLFIDGNDEDSLKAALKLYQVRPDMRVVLTAGSPAEVSEILNKRIFFDQGGALVRVFGIQAVPALLFNGPEGPTGAEFAPTALNELAPLL